MSEPESDVDQAQLEVYARDLQRLSRRERDMSTRLDSAVHQLEAYALDLKKTIEAERARAAEAEEAYRTTLVRLARALDLRDRETGAHAERLADYAAVLCEAMGLSAGEATLVCLAAPLHDLGKVGIPDAILLKAEPLDEAEFKVMKTHCGLGASLLRGSSSPWLRTAHDVALTHHEAWNGSGYPRGLKGTQIPLSGRIVKVADCYDTIRSTRPYSKALGPDEARRALLEGDDKTQPDHFDPRVLDAFDRVHREFDEIFRTRGGS